MAAWFSALLGKLALKKCSCEELPGGRLSGVLLAGRAGRTDVEPTLLAQLASDLFSGLLLWPGPDSCGVFEYVGKAASHLFGSQKKVR